MAITEDQYDELADLVSRLRAENARLREAGQAVVDSHPMTPSYQIEALRAALKEGGGE